MEDNIKLNVLWVDDMPTEEFMDEAYEYGLDITSATSVNKGLSLLKDESFAWDAIILDANCKLTDDEQEQPSLMSLKEALSQLVHMRTEVPWFVYTGGDYEGVGHLEFMIKDRPYDDRLYYEKPKQRYDLYDNIKKVASKKTLYVLRQRYQREFDAATLIEGATQELVKGLTYDYEDSPGSVQDYFNPARKIIERIFKKLKEQKLLPPINKLNSMSKFLCEKKYEDSDCSFVLKKEVMPMPLCHSLKFFLDITQDGSHDTDDLKLGVDSYIRNTKNTNLFNSILYIAMDLLLWHMDYSKTQTPVEEIWEGDFKFEYVGKLCKSATGRYWYTGEYEVFGDPSFTDGAKIGIKKSITNIKPKPGVSKFVPKGCWVIIE
jgi:hypothetical protein